MSHFVRISLCRGALAHLLPGCPVEEEPGRTLAAGLASALRHALSPRYAPAQVVVEVQPAWVGRLRLHFALPGVDPAAEGEHIWEAARLACRRAYS